MRPTTSANLACAKCGYLLQGLSSTQSCPECGWPIARSIAAAVISPHLTLPFRRIARSYFFDLGILLVAAVPLLSMSLFVMATLTRLVTLCRLRALLSEAELPVGIRSGPVFVALLVIQLFLPAVPLFIGASPWLTVIGWTVSALIGALLAGLFASHVATILDHESVRQQLRAQRAVLVVTAVTCLLPAILLQFFSPQYVIGIQAVVLAFLGLIAIGHTSVALSTLATAIRDTVPLVQDH